MKPITVMLVDDNRLFRKALRRTLERESNFRVVGEAQDGRQAVAMVRELHPAVVLMDVAMPQLNGFQATRQILSSFPNTKVLMISVSSDDAYVKEAAKAGAMGYLFKQTSAINVCQAILEIQKGNKLFKSSVPPGFG